MTPWTEKHRPKNLEDLKGQDPAIEEIKKFISEFNSGKIKKTAILLHGPPGIGKTTLAHVIAKEENSEIFELNASDLRNKGKLQEILKPALQQKSLINKSKIVLVDEADGISAIDRGGLSELINLINISKYPIIITANDVWNKKLSTLRKKAKILALREIDYKEIKNVLISILRKENKFVDNEVLTKISVKAKGDLRAAINDLQTISKLENVDGIEFDERNKETDIFNALKSVFQNKPTESLMRIYDSVKMPIDEIILWIEKNIPEIYNGKELVRAYELLSKVDLFKGRIYKQQYWRFLVYENIFLSYGISSCKEFPKTGFVSYKKPTRILKIWMNNQRTISKKSICTKYATHVHVGIKRAMNEFGIIKQIINSNPEIQKELKLTDDEIQYLHNQ